MNKTEKTMKQLFKSILWPIMAFLTLLIATSCGNKGSEPNEGNILQDDSLAKTDTLISDEQSIEVGPDTLRSFDVESKDTLDIATFLIIGNDILNDMKKIHIKEVSDTLKYEYLRGKWDYLDHCALHFDMDEMKHSDKISYLKLSVSMFEELERLSKDMDAAGIKGGFSEKEKRLAQEYKEKFKKKLWLEIH